MQSITTSIILNLRCDSSLFVLDPVSQPILEFLIRDKGQLLWWHSIMMLLVREIDNQRCIFTFLIVCARLCGRRGEIHSRVTSRLTNHNIALFPPPTASFYSWLSSGRKEVEPWTLPLQYGATRNCDIIRKTLLALDFE